MRSPYYTNEDLESLIDDLKNETENSMKIALIKQFLMLKEIKDNQLKKINKCNIVHTEPTDNRNDIIVGGGYNPLQEGYTPKSNCYPGRIIPPQGGTGECKSNIKDIIINQFKKDNNFPTAQYILNADLMVNEIFKRYNITSGPIVKSGVTGPTDKETGMFYELHPDGKCHEKVLKETGMFYELHTEANDGKCNCPICKREN